MVRCPVEESCLQQFLASQDQARRLRPAQALAARIGYRIDPLLQIPIGRVRPLGRGIDKSRHAVPLSGRCHVCHRDRPPLGRIAKHQQHGRAVRQSRVEFGERLDLDHFDADHAHGVIVPVAVARLDDDLVFHARSVGQPRHFLVIRAGHASGCNLAQRRGATIGNEPPLALHQLADARSNGLHQLVEVDVLLGGFDHGLPHLRQDQ